jgi:hypothetical protein
MQGIAAQGILLPSFEVRPGVDKNDIKINVRGGVL